MNGSELSLAVIAVATLVMALVQVGVIVGLLRVGRQAQQIMSTIQQEVRPLIAKANAVADDAGQAAALARAQAEKVDRLVSDLSRRVEETAAMVQEAIITPAREGRAIVAAVRAALAALRGGQPRPRHGRQAEEEDPLFIG